MTPAALLLRTMSAPTPADLRDLQAALLAAETVPDRRGDARRALDAAGELHDYLCELSAKLSAREYSHIASLLDIGAVGAVAVENLVDVARRTPLQVGLAALSEGLMVLASRQYVRAWEREMLPLATRAAWFARRELWRLSRERQPELDDDARLASIDALLQPILADETPPEARFALAGRLLQVLVVASAACALAQTPRRAVD